MLRISVIFGTRPEAIKLSPVIHALRSYSGIKTEVCAAAQHRQMLDQVLHTFDIVPDRDLDLMRTGQTLSELTARAIETLDGYVANAKPDLVLVQGDTTTTFATALCCFYNKVPIGHVEAGLRSHNKLEPFPEEVNRIFVTRVADYHFAPTPGARDNLLREGVAEQTVFLAGNTVIDALHFALEKIRREPPAISGLPAEVLLTQRARSLVLITAHRRENFGPGLHEICAAITTLAKSFPLVSFVYPVHLNPHIYDHVHEWLRGIPNVHLIGPLEYLDFVALMERATLILTDSGGIQEEAPSLGKPVLVMRNTTERLEAVAAGVAKLVGTNRQRIVDAVSQLLMDRGSYLAMVKSQNPFGDGKAGERIAAICHEVLRGKA